MVEEHNRAPARPFRIDLEWIEPDAPLFSHFVEKGKGKGKGGKQDAVDAEHGQEQDEDGNEKKKSKRRRPKKSSKPEGSDKKSEMPPSRKEIRQRINAVLAKRKGAKTIEGEPPKKKSKKDKGKKNAEKAATADGQKPQQSTSKGKGGGADSPAAPGKSSGKASSSSKAKGTQQQNSQHPSGQQALGWNWQGKGQQMWYPVSWWAPNYAAYGDGYGMTWSTPSQPLDSWWHNPPLESWGSLGWDHKAALDTAQGGITERSWMAPALMGAREGATFCSSSSKALLKPRKKNKKVSTIKK